MTEAENRAKANYRKKTKSITIEFYPAEMDLFEHLQKQEQKRTYIKNLIREDMNKGDQN